MKVLFYITFLGFIFSCNSLDKPDPVASYIYIPSIAMANQPGYGTARQDFTEAWVYLDGNLIGAFPIPALVPLIKAGNGEITVFAGIHVNGIKSASELYPLMDRYVKVVKLTPGKIDTIQPVVGYRPEVTPIIIEGFEGLASVFPDKLHGKGISFISDDVFEGTKSGALEMDTLAPLNEVASFELNTLPKDGTKIYVELHFKNEVDFLVGLKGYSGINEATQYIVGLRPSTEWQKVYIDITDEVMASDFPNYKLLIQSGLPFDGNKLTLDKARILIDNVKLMY